MVVGISTMGKHTDSPSQTYLSKSHKAGNKHSCCRHCPCKRANGYLTPGWNKVMMQTELHLNQGEEYCDPSCKNYRFLAKHKAQGVLQLL
jgi:hypothetical protein